MPKGESDLTAVDPNKSISIDNFFKNSLLYGEAIVQDGFLGKRGLFDGKFGQSGTESDSLSRTKHKHSLAGGECENLGPRKWKMVKPEGS